MQKEDPPKFIRGFPNINLKAKYLKALKYY